MKVFRMNLDGTCSVCQTISFGGQVGAAGNAFAAGYGDVLLDARAPITISAPVGNRKAERVKNGGNRVADVRTVQIALNRFSPTDGGPSQKLVVDGMVGQRTEYAVEFFQRKWGFYPKGWSGPDVIVDVEGRTIDRLRVGPPTTKQSGKELALATLPRVLAMLTAAQTTVRAAIASAATKGPPFLKQMDPIGQAALATVNSAFKTEGSPTLKWDLTFISTMLDRMHMAAGQAYRTQGIFEEEPSYMTSPGSGMAVMGGFFKPERVLCKIDRDQEIEISSGIVYFTPWFKVFTTEGQQFVVIHELAHYAGPLDPTGIEDFAYHNKPEYGKLPRARAMLNADSYAKFVFACNGMPDFVIRAVDLP